MASRKLQSGYEQMHRPQFHFSPVRGWMNDPNGLVYLDGVYHLFYQYRPDGLTWGNIHWGHARSCDLVRWEHQPIALYPEPEGLGIVASGGAVWDAGNTSGLNLDGGGVLVATFSHFPENGRQVQSLAYSTDRGQTWRMYDGNPVLDNPGVDDFRDPKVFWHAPRRRWIMALAVGRRVHLYASSDLKQWALLQEFGEAPGAHLPACARGPARARDDSPNGVHLELRRLP